MARSLDHCVLPVSTLASARERLASLGFTVAADAAHPFGTGNCCIFFSDGSYLEPLAIIDGRTAGAARRNGNVFVARDAAFREAAGEEGFSAVVLGTPDADSDHEAFVSTGISAGPPLAFSRPFVDAAGRQAEASFKLAFATPEPDGPVFFFTVQRVKTPMVDRSSLENHANGVTGIARILMSAQEPARYRTFLTAFSGGEARAGEEGCLEVALSSAVLSLFPSGLLEKAFGIAAVGLQSRLCLPGIVFRLNSLAAMRERLTTSRIRFTEQAGRIAVQPAPGQGAWFFFEEHSA